MKVLLPYPHVNPTILLSSSNTLSVHFYTLENKIIIMPINKSEPS